jgi:aryl-alcohol dehydrogenase-like predicted oxidoreductase
MSTILTQRNQIAETGIAVSPIGFGTVKLGRDKAVKYPTGFTIPDDKAALHLLELAWDLGINLIDTAPAYGNSEQRLGELLPNMNKEWVIATKVGELFDPTTGESSYNFTPEFIQTSIEQSLKRLNREQLDIVLIHSDGNDVEIIEQGALEVLNDLKQQGLIRATGISSKTVDGGLLALQLADIAMVMHNLDYQAEQAVIEHAQQTNKAIFIKKAFASGHITNAQQDSVQASFDFIFKQPAVSSVVIGTINPQHLQGNVAKANKALGA